MKIRALIVDDEPLARRGVRELLRGEPDVEVVGEADDGMHALAEIHRLSPDLVFLDVQMPGLDGFEVLDQLEVNRYPVVVFITAHEAHALRAFGAHAVDYLLKPLDPERFREALTRSRHLLAGRNLDDAAASTGLDERLRDLLSTVREGRTPERLLIRSPGGITVVPVSEIDWIEADGDYARLHLPGRDELLRETLQSLESRLDKGTWVRIHRSYIVRIDRIRQIRALENGDAVVMLDAGRELPVSRTHREDLLRILRGRP